MIFKVLPATCLKSHFDMKDPSTLPYFLGIEVAHSSKELSLSQRNYMTNLLKESCMLGSKHTDTLTDPSDLIRMWEMLLIILVGVEGGLENSTFLLLDQAFPMLLVSWVDICSLLTSIISRLLVVSKNILKGLLTKACPIAFDSFKCSWLSYVDWVSDPLDHQPISSYCIYV